MQSKKNLSRLAVGDSVRCIFLLQGVTEGINDGKGACLRPYRPGWN